MLQRISRKPTACGKEIGRKGEADGGRKEEERQCERIGVEPGGITGLEKCG